MKSELTKIRELIARIKRLREANTKRVVVKGVGGAVCIVDVPKK